MNRVGIGYDGSSDLKTSTANMQLIPVSPVEWTVGYRYYKFSFMNNHNCHIKINNDENVIYLRANQGFEINEVDAPIHSFVIVESGIEFNWVGER